MPETYTCTICQQTYEKGRSDTEAIAESTDIFGATAAEDLAVICDDCWQCVQPHP